MASVASNVSIESSLDLASISLAKASEPRESLVRYIYIFFFVNTHTRGTTSHSNMATCRESRSDYYFNSPATRERDMR